MSYASVEQLVELFGPHEVAELSTRGDSGDPADLDKDVIELAIARAASEVDSYLGSRFPVPLAEPIPDIVMMVTADIVRYRLTSGDVSEKSPILARYNNALGWLRDVAAGKITVPGLAQGDSDEVGNVLIEPGSRPWDGVTP